MKDESLEIKNELKLRLYREILKTDHSIITASDIRIGYELTKDPYIQNLFNKIED